MESYTLHALFAQKIPMEATIYVLDTKEQSVRDNNYTESNLKMFVRDNILHCT